MRFKCPQSAHASHFHAKNEAAEVAPAVLRRPEAATTRNVSPSPSSKWTIEALAATLAVQTKTLPRNFLFQYKTYTSYSEIMTTDMVFTFP